MCVGEICYNCRLPIVQAGTFALLAPTLSYLSLPEWQCPTDIGQFALFLVRL